MSPLLFSVMLLASDPTTTAAPAASDSTEQAAPVKKEKKICKTDPEYTGSRMKKQICLTAAEWTKRTQTGVGSDRAGRTYTAQ
jgi:hypothetical protein